MDNPVLGIVAIGLLGISFCIFMALGVDAFKGRRKKVDEASSKAEKFGVFLVVVKGRWDGARTFYKRSEATAWANDTAARGEDCKVYQHVESHEARYQVKTETFD